VAAAPPAAADPAAGWLTGPAAATAGVPELPAAACESPAAPGAAALDGPETARSEADFLAAPAEQATVPAVTPTASAATAILCPMPRRDPM
jgi:hypothetical protein